MPVMRFLYRKYPAFLEKVEKRPEIYNRQVAYVRQREKEGAAFVLAPREDLGCDGMVRDPALLQHVYDLGRQEMEGRLAALKEFVQSGG